MSESDASTVFDAIVIGTGFGGAVTACRLVEAGLKICVLERGRRYGPGDFPRYPAEELFALDDDKKDNFKPLPDFSRWLWSHDHGIYDVRELGDAVSVQAAGYGGGSLIYVNVHLRPPRDVFNEAWPEEYRVRDGVWNLDEYLNLAAHMLRVSPIPKQLAKTIQLKNAATKVGPENHWFRTPLAVNFEETSTNAFGRPHQPCDMRGRCWLGCDHDAKNTLDKNYLARAEQGTVPPDIHTLADVKCIKRESDGVFTVTYENLLRPAGQDAGDGRTSHTVSVRAQSVFLCAGSLNTTELLLKNWPGLTGATADGTPVGSHYFPNSDSIGAVFGCNEPHEADYGPTITAALLHRSPVDGDFSCSLDFHEGTARDAREPLAGTEVRGERSGATATLSHTPLLDWGNWTGNAAGALVLTGVDHQFEPGARRFERGETLQIGKHATARVRSGLVRHQHWFLAEDGGYPPDLEPLVGMFRSPLWLRRNRYVEIGRTTSAGPPGGTPMGPLHTMPTAPLRRPQVQHLRLQSFSDSVLGTARRTGSPLRPLDAGGLSEQLSATRLLAAEISSFFPDWFVGALKKDRKELLDQGAAFALPLLGRLLGDVSKTVAEQADSDMLARLLDLPVESVSDNRRQVFVRGMLRQALQILAGSEAAIATKAANALLAPVPGTPEELLRLLGDVLLWALAYGTTEGHTGIILTMGQDLYRGRLFLDPARRLCARLPNRLLDSSGVIQERVLRSMASDAWRGELRTNPAWTTFGKRVTVHSQGGCPMGDRGLSVTDPWGEVHECPGLYVMDAAAFPTSVGVNPSATIAAVAEMKIEHFIRKRDPGWTSRDMPEARAWVDRQGRADIDPLNQRSMQDNEAPKGFGVIGLTFGETMSGFLDERPGPRTDFTDLQSIRGTIPAFTDAEDRGTRQGSTITVRLEAATGDLARLIAPEQTVDPLKMTLSGSISFDESTTHAVSGTLEIFVRGPGTDARPEKFFRYHLTYGDGDQEYELDGLKVLHPEPGPGRTADVWGDFSTLYFEIATRSGAAADRVRRGVLRISLQDFLQGQMRSMNITGTEDPARKSWALAAFYQYFAHEMVTIYVERMNALKNAVVSVLTGIHV